MIPRLVADIGSVPDLVIGAAIVLIAALLAIKVVGTIMRLLVLLLLGIGIYVWVS